MDTVIWVKLQAIIRALRRSEEPKNGGPKINENDIKIKGIYKSQKSFLICQR